MDIIIHLVIYEKVIEINLERVAMYHIKNIEEAILIDIHCGIVY